MISVSRHLDKDDSNIKCYNVRQERGKHGHGEQCNRLLAKRNSRGEIAGEFACPICHIVYEVIENKMTPVKYLNKATGKYETIGR